MLRPQRFEHELDPARSRSRRARSRSTSPACRCWIPGHPVASHMISLLNVVLPAAERWFVATYNEGAATGARPRLAEDIRGFIGQEATHADTHQKILQDFMVARGADVEPLLRQVDYVFSRVLAPTTATDPKRRLNHLCDRLWLIAAIEHYTAVLGDFALNCAWDDHGADPTVVDVFRWHGSEEVEHRNVAHDVAVHFHDSYLDRIRSMGLAVALIIGFFQRGVWHLCRTGTPRPTSAGGACSACGSGTSGCGCCPPTGS